MTKPVIVTRAGKGSSLTWTEGDTNLTNLQNATLTVSDGTTSKALNLNDTLSFVAGTNTAVAVNGTTGAVTITANPLTAAAAEFTRNASQTTGISAGSAILFNATSLSIGSGISLDTSTGIITLAAGKTYKLTGEIGRIDGSGSGAYMDYQWRNVTTGSVIGTLASIVVVTSGSNAANSSTAYAMVTADVTTQVKLEIIGTASVSIVGQYNQYPVAMVEVMGGVQGPQGAPGGTAAGSDTQLQFNSAGSFGATSSLTWDGAYLNTTGLSLRSVKETVYANGSITGTFTPNAAIGTVQTATLTGNITINGFTGAVAGQSVTLILTQDGTGSRTLTSTMKFAGGVKTLSTAASSIDIMTVYYDGTNYYASLSKGFA